MNKLPTIFGNDTLVTQAKQAIQNLVTGTTPIKSVRRRTIRGGKEANYVDTYYMTRQASLITGFRWSSKCLKEVYRPDELKPREIGVLMEVTLYDQEGHAFSHQSWGSAGVAVWNKDGNDESGVPHKAGDIIAFFDALKSAYSDGIKKCLSYFGIANDIYGGRELDYFGSLSQTNEDGTPVVIVHDITAERNAFDNYVRNQHIRYDLVLRLLQVKSINDVPDYAQAYQTVRQWVEGGRQAI